MDTSPACMRARKRSPWVDVPKKGRKSAARGANWNPSVDSGLSCAISLRLGVRRIVVAPRGGSAGSALPPCRSSATRLQPCRRDGYGQRWRWGAPWRVDLACDGVGRTGVRGRQGRRAALWCGAEDESARGGNGRTAAAYAAHVTGGAFRVHGARREDWSGGLRGRGARRGNEGDAGDREQALDTVAARGEGINAAWEIENERRVGVSCWRCAQARAGSEDARGAQGGDTISADNEERPWPAPRTQGAANVVHRSTIVSRVASGAPGRGANRMLRSGAVGIDRAEQASGSCPKRHDPAVRTAVLLSPRSRPLDS
ncbi:hypothetical protein B0H19DRAFT_1061608 [Mycena capillaripes]|nr:hypothetical protein B0H19DRAFT_1061608 [Mycena capillaripes]